MPTFDEEVMEIPIFNGLGIVDTFDTRLCRSLQNLFLAAPDELQVREDYLELQESVKTAVAIPTTQAVPRHLHKTCIEVFTAVGSQTVDSPTLLTFFDDGGATRTCEWLNCNNTTPQTTSQTLAATYGVKAFCQFRDRYYAASATKIFRISNFNTGGGALTVTDLATVSVDLLLTFRSRMFGIKGSRIYYTDLPAIGGYPETWNINLNFVDIPSVDFGINCYNAQVYRDKIYLFTDKGIYVFAVSGDPINWSIQLVSANFPIFDRDSVCIAKNLVFLTDQWGVYQFDGVNFTKISNNIRALFSVDISFVAAWAWHSIYPYEDGIVLIRNNFFSNAGNYTSSSSNSWYYYNLNVWVQLQMSTERGVIKAGTALLPYRGRNPSSWIYFECDNAGTNSQLRAMILDPGQWRGDCLNTNHSGGARTAKTVTLQTPAIFFKQRRHVKAKYLEMYGQMNMAPTISMTWNGEAVQSSDQGKYQWKIPMSATQLSHYVASNELVLNLSGTVNADAGGDWVVVPFVIRGLDLVYNKDNRNRDSITGMAVN